VWEHFPRVTESQLLFTWSDKHSHSHQLFNDATKLAVAYKENSADFIDEVTRELEVRKAPLRALLLSDYQLCSFFPSGKADHVAEGETLQAWKDLPCAGDTGRFVCCSWLDWKGRGGGPLKSPRCPRLNLKEQQQSVAVALVLLSTSLSCSFPELCPAAEE